MIVRIGYNLAWNHIELGLPVVFCLSDSPQQRALRQVLLCLSSPTFGHDPATCPWCARWGDGIVLPHRRPALLRIRIVSCDSAEPLTESHTEALGSSLGPPLPQRRFLSKGPKNIFEKRVESTWAKAYLPCCSGRGQDISQPSAPVARSRVSKETKGLGKKTSSLIRSLTR